jgi:alpha-tubulin suppressor-like RCC1 family protein
MIKVKYISIRYFGGNHPGRSIAISSEAALSGFRVVSTQGGKMTRKHASFGLIVLCILVLAVSGGPDLVAQAGSGASPAAAPLPVTQVAAGFEHTCVLVSGGSVYCWGSNRYGQLGNPDQTIHPFPQLVAVAAGPVTAIAAGGYHTCAIISGGAVICWGQNSSGQLGNGATINSPSPVAVIGIAGATAITAGYDYTCVLIGAGAQCWGDDTYGQLGNGFSGPGAISSTPAAVSGLAGAAAISASFDHTCALISGGTVQCWGRNKYGQLGNGTINDSPTPVGVSASGTTFKFIAAGAQHTCAIAAAGSVFCWGDGSLGQMGNNTTITANSLPVQVNSVSNASRLSAGGYSDTGHTCALTTAGAVLCWGSNDFGQAGNGSVAHSQSTPVTSLASGVSAIAVGVNHSCALMSDQTVRCWGSDSSGQLGDGVNSISTMPVPALGGEKGVTQLGTGDRNTCALVNGSLRCWGNNRNNQLGDGTAINRSGLTAVAGLTGAVTAVDSGMNQTCAIVDGGVKCWGNGTASPASLIPAGSQVTSLSITNLHGCAVVNGGAQCWGDDSRGQIGDGQTTGSRSTPFAVPSLTSGIKSVATGQWFSCALTTGGSVYCWGDDANGQLGIGTASPTPFSTPQLIGGFSGATMIAAGQDHACALTSAGAMYCWGNNQQYQLGDGSQTQHPSPNLVSTLVSGVTQITAGGYHTCALVNSGVKCWGFNSFGQLGNGTTSYSKSPANVINLTGGVTAVVAGGVNYDEEQTCAITVQQALLCWGGDEYGQLGDNLPILRASPVKVLGLAGVPELGANYTSGQAGSFFRLAAAGFPASTPLTILVNGRYVGAITSTKSGYALFHFHPATNVTGAITVEISGTGAAVNLSLSAGSGTLHAMEGSGRVYGSSPVQVFLPGIIK